jgi:hypothetical protein
MVFLAVLLALVESLFCLFHSFRLEAFVQLSYLHTVDSANSMSPNLFWIIHLPVFCPFARFNANFHLPDKIKEILDVESWLETDDKLHSAGVQKINSRRVQ